MSDERIIGMLVQFKDDTSRQLEEIKEILKDDHAKRLSSLEMTRSYVYGVIAAVSTLSSAVGVYVGKFFFHVSH